MSMAVYGVTESNTTVTEQQWQLHREFKVVLHLTIC